VAALALALTGLFAGTASAGSNGQTVTVCNAQSSYTRVLVGGRNQNGQWTQVWLSRNGGAFCATVWDYWFKGDLWADFYDANWNRTASWYCGWVPEWQNNNDMWGCYGPR